MEHKAGMNIEIGDVVTVRKGTYHGLLEIDYVDDVLVQGRIPYASTYEPGGQYEGSYRGRQSAWIEQVASIERKAQS